jgi:galactose oxidase-like protein
MTTADIGRTAFLGRFDRSARGVAAAGAALALFALAAPRPAGAFDATTLPANTWVKLTTGSPYPSERGWNRGIYNPVDRTIVHYEGFIDAQHPYTIYSNSIWAYDFVSNQFTVKTVSPWHGGTSPSDWYLVASCTLPCESVHPFDRHPYGGLVYDTQDNVMVLFGGVNAESGKYDFDDTWAYSVATNSWTNMNPVIHPAAREEHCMAYAPTTNQAILFKGSCSACSDVWAYSYTTNTWTRKDYTGQVLPSDRRTHSMVWVPSLNRIMLYGGKDDVNFLGDTWMYDPVNNVWTNVTPTFSPPPRLSAGLAYDTRNRVVLMYGGYGTAAELNDTWVYHPDTNRWEALFPPATPGLLGRTDWRLTYDEANGVFLLWQSATTFWAFKYVPSGGTLDSSAPAAVRDLRPR